jgi:hypothetical protein
LLRDLRPYNAAMLRSLRVVYQQGDHVRPLIGALEEPLNASIDVELS